MGPGSQILVSSLLKELAYSAVDIHFAEWQGTEVLFKPL